MTPNPLARANAPADPRWTGSRRSVHRLGRWLLALAVALVLGGLFAMLRNTGGADGGLAAVVGGVTVGVAGLFAVLPRWRHRSGLRPPRAVRRGVWTAWAGWVGIGAGAVLAFVSAAHLVAAVAAGVGLGLLTFGYGRALLALPARRAATTVDTALLAVIAVAVPALLLAWFGSAVIGSGDHAARYGARVDVVEVGRCSRVLPRADGKTYVCHRAAWRDADAGAGAALRHGSFYFDRLDARPGNRAFDPAEVPAYAAGDRAFGPRHVGAVDPIVVLAPAAGWLQLAVPVAVLCLVPLYWRRRVRGARTSRW